MQFHIYKTRIYEDFHTQKKHNQQEVTRKLPPKYPQASKLTENTQFEDVKELRQSKK